MNFVEYLKLYRIQLLKTFLCFITFISLGGCNTLLGSSLLDIQIRVREPFEKVTGLIPSRAIGYMFGGILAALLGNKLNTDLTLFLANSSGALLIGLAPWFYSYQSIYWSFLGSGVSQGLLDITINTYVFVIWGSKAATYIQILHSSFGIGSIITPLVTKTFLLPDPSGNDTETATDEEVFATYSPNEVKVQYAFLVIAVILLSTAFGFLAFYFAGRASKKTSDSASNKEVAINDDTPRWKCYLAIALVAFLANASFGLQTLVGNLGPSFVVKSDLHMTKKDGATLVTVFWVFYTFYRYCHIGLIRCVKEIYIMYCCYVAVIISALVLAPHAAHNQVCIWISMVLLGGGYSPTFAYALNTLQKYFYLSNRNASFIFIIGITGESIHPWICNKLMIKSQVIFTYYLAILSTLQILACFILPFACNKIFKPSERHDYSRTGSIRSFTR